MHSFNSYKCLVCGLTPKSTVMVMSRRSVSLTKPHFFQGKLRLSSKPVLSAHTFTRNQQQPFLNQENDCTGFIQASLNKIQGLLKTILQFSRTKSLGKILI